MAKKARKTRARKPSAKAQAATTETAKPSETLKIISEGQFNTLVRLLRGHESNKNEAVGAIGSAIADAVERKHLDRKAFGIFRTLARMSDERLATTLAHLDHYRQIGGLDDRAAQQSQMFDREETDNAIGDTDSTSPVAVEQSGNGATRQTFAEKLKDAQGGREHHEVIRDAVDELDPAQPRH